MRMSATNLRIIKTLIVVDLLIVALCLIVFDTQILLNTQIAYISSLLIMLASLSSYKKMVRLGVDSGAILAHSDRDTLDKLDDPYDLYGQEEGDEKEENDSTEVKEVKKRGRSFSDTLKDSKPSFSFYRIGSYLFLVLGFLYLNRQNLLHIPSYLLSLALPILTIVFILVDEGKKDKSHT
jgi:hypothetical protein